MSKQLSEEEMNRRVDIMLKEQIRLVEFWTKKYKAPLNVIMLNLAGVFVSIAESMGMTEEDSFSMLEEMIETLRQAKHATASFEGLTWTEEGGGA